MFVSDLQAIVTGTKVWESDGEGKKTVYVNLPVGDLHVQFEGTIREALSTFIAITNVRHLSISCSVAKKLQLGDVEDNEAGTGRQNCTNTSFTCKNNLTCISMVSTSCKLRRLQVLSKVRTEMQLCLTQQQK